jgi:hypothetical protein
MGGKRRPAGQSGDPSIWGTQQNVRTTPKLKGPARFGWAAPFRFIVEPI